MHHDEDDQVAPLWREMEVRLKSAFCNPEHGPELVEKMETLLEEGLEWNALGLRLLPKRMVDEGQKDPMLPLPIRITKEQRDILSSLFLAPSDHTTITWDLDVLRPPPPTAEEPTNDMVALARDGILKMEDWGLPDQLLEELSNIASKLLTPGTTAYYPDLQV